MEAALGHVPDVGWTTEALGRGARDLGLPPTAHGLCPGGALELIEYFHSRCNAQLGSAVGTGTEAFTTLGTTAKVRACVLARLEMLLPYASKWPQALSLMATPPNTLNAIQHLAEVCDTVWVLSGDRSLDYNWYTKRLLLGGVYASTELFMVTLIGSKGLPQSLPDKDDTLQQTREFLDRRLKDVAWIGKTQAGISARVGLGLSSLGSIMSVCFVCNALQWKFIPNMRRVNAHFRADSSEAHSNFTSGHQGNECYNNLLATHPIKE